MEGYTPKLLDAQLKAIVGFEIKVTEVQAAYKLSQNRNETDYQRIIDHLKKEGDSDSEEIGEQMEKRLEK